MSANGSTDPVELDPRTVAACADVFFTNAAAGDWEAVLAVTAPRMTAWQSGGPEAVPFTDMIPTFRRMRERLGWWEYRDVKRIIGANGFCEQHTVRFHRPDGTTRDIAACVVGYLDASGRLVRLDEYLDPSEVSTWNP